MSAQKVTERVGKSLKAIVLDDRNYGTLLASNYGVPIVSTGGDFEQILRFDVAKKGANSYDLIVAVKYFSGAIQILKYELVTQSGVTRARLLGLRPVFLQPPAMTCYSQ